MSTPRSITNTAQNTPPSDPKALAQYLKARAIENILECDHDLYHNTRNEHYAWHAWQLARRCKVEVPRWVLKVVDAVAARDISNRNRQTKTADRYEAALTQMDAAITRHRRRGGRRQLAKQLGIPVAVSRRDRANVTAIAREAAKAHKVSLNRLLAKYRASR